MPADLPDLRKQVMTEEFWRNRDEEHRRRARRTVVLSIVCAGLIALFIGRWIEVQIYNQQRGRNITNCTFVQDDRRDRVSELQASSDKILGNPGHRNKKGKLDPIPAADFSKPPFEQFKSFQKLIVAQAQADRGKAATISRRIENCYKVFPKRKAFWIF